MNETSDVAIEFLNVRYGFDRGKSLLSDFNLAVRRGETLMLLGRSGSGKTSLLKLINRLLEPTGGEVRIDGKPAQEWDVIQLRRHLGYAIQDVGLFPHYTIRQNVGLLPKLEQWDRPRIAQRVEEVLRLVGLAPAEFASRYPSQLSGGQKQRVGLARALAADPPILLMDEPFGALDPITRAELQREFHTLRRQLGKTVVFVTHDVSEALLLGDRIALMEPEKLRGIYTPREFVDSADPHVRSYMEAFRAGQRILQS
jgi:osmoprotectant transport system ATP-binding protein